MSDTGKTCKTCIHFKAEDGVEMVYDWGSCTRFPPSVMLDGEFEPYTTFPLVNDDERCGEWRAAQ